jgi:hypothetical protein
MATEQSETINIPTNGVIIAGGRTYRLALQSLTTVNDEIEAARTRLMTEAKAAADMASETIRETARLAAEAVLRDARRTQERAEAALRSAGANQPPQWAVEAHLPLRWRANANAGRNLWEILFTARVQIEGFDWANFAIPGKPGWSTLEAVQYELWLPIQEDGSWNVSLIHAHTVNDQLPHIGTDHSCLSIGENTTRPLNSYEDFTRAVAAISRAMRRIQMDSLLVAATAWRKRLEKFLPDDFNEMLKGTTYRGNPAGALQTYVASHGLTRQAEQGAIWQAGA